VPPNSGQASTEYVAVLLVIGAILAGAATVAIAAPGVGERVVRTVRTGLCIVGGDVCRDSDARAAGLLPCVTAERSDRQDTTLDIAVLRLGGHGEWQLALQSDGRAVVTRLEESDIGATVGVGLTFSPAGVRADASAALVAGFHGGRAWRFADAAAARAFLEAAMRDASVYERRAPDLSWRALKERAGGELSLVVADLAKAGLTVGADAALGMREDGARRTLTLDLGIDDPAFAVELPGLRAAPGTRRSWIADVSWEHGALRELVLRSATGDSKRRDEYSARLDLRDPANRAAAERVLQLHVPGRAELAALAARMRSAGVVEYDGYSVAERRRGISVAGKLGVALGFEHEQVSSEQRLVDAVVWVRGGPPQRRFDCIGV
jgi:hypothetical protein